MTTDKLQRVVENPENYLRSDLIDAVKMLAARKKKLPPFDPQV